jgi:hypothetical protein
MVTVTDLQSYIGDSALIAGDAPEGRPRLETATVRSARRNECTVALLR